MRRNPLSTALPWRLQIFGATKKAQTANSAHLLLNGSWIETTRFSSTHLSTDVNECKKMFSDQMILVDKTTWHRRPNSSKFKWILNGACIVYNGIDETFDGKRATNIPLLSSSWQRLQTQFAHTNLVNIFKGLQFNVVHRKKQNNGIMIDWFSSSPSLCKRNQWPVFSMVDAGSHVEWIKHRRSFLKVKVKRASLLQNSKMLRRLADKVKRIWLK